MIIEPKVNLSISLQGRGVWSKGELLKTTQVKQSINLCKEAYLYMISKECPDFSTKKEWIRLSKTQRLEKHLQRICDHFNGTEFTYQVFED